MADITISQDEFERLQALVQTSEAVRQHFTHLTTLARPITRHDVTQAPTMSAFHEALAAAQGIEAREVKHADQPRTPAAKKRRA